VGVGFPIGAGGGVAVVGQAGTLPDRVKGKEDVSLLKTEWRADRTPADLETGQGDRLLDKGEKGVHGKAAGNEFLLT